MADDAKPANPHGTVFKPSAAASTPASEAEKAFFDGEPAVPPGAPAAPDPSAASDPPAGLWDRFAEHKPAAPGEPPAAPEPDEPPAAAEPDAEAVADDPPHIISTTGRGRIADGTVLNGIFRIRRFIARGGMGEVYEGVNTNNANDRVAIKIILQHFVADPEVQSLFNKEADTLMRLSHPSLVQYRLIAREEQLDMLYIVTEFIAGKSLSDMLPALKGGRREIVALLRWLGAGLAAAHAQGIVHRDISPDNILLPDDKWERAKLIDFGIAKDLNRGSHTVIKGGIVGKFAFMAPEQFGDHVNVGAWTDIYSLALVLLAVARGKPVDMGTNAAVALAKRTRVPDLTDLPPDLRPLFKDMLAPEPRARPQSLDDVLSRLDKIERAPQRKEKPPKGETAALSWIWPPSRPLLAGLVVLALLLGVAAFVFLSRPSAPVTVVHQSHPPATEQVRVAVEGALKDVTCSWLDQEPPSQGGDGVVVTLSGVAPEGSAMSTAPIDAALAPLSTAYKIETPDVLRADARQCGLLDALRALRQPNSREGRAFAPHELDVKGGSGSVNCTKKGRTGVVIDVVDRESDADIGIFGVGADGNLTALMPDRENFLKHAEHYRMPGDGKHYAMEFCAGQESVSPEGRVGFLMLTGPGPFLTSPGGPKGEEIAASAAEQKLRDGARLGWKAQMAWVHIAAPDPVSP